MNNIKRLWRLSPSAIKQFKKCPVAYRNQQVFDLVPVEQAEHFRIGTHWHKCLEILDQVSEGPCICTHPYEEDHIHIAKENCPICNGSGVLPKDLMDAVVCWLNYAYRERPLSKTEADWEVERIKILYSVVGYRWYWSQHEAEYKTDETEIKFDLSILSPISKRALPHTSMRGKIDRRLSRGDLKFIMEHKSTSSSLEPDSDYWKSLTLDTQAKLYAYSERRAGHGLVGVLWDPWHKPTISPKMLTQGESAEFVEDGIYCNEQFTVALTDAILVNDRTAEFEKGKKEGTFAIRETPEMYGARLLQDITTRPEFYFARKELAYTDADLDAFELELFNIYQDLRVLYKTNGWWRRETECENMGKCDYIGLCYNNVVIDDQDCPEGFRKIERKN